MSWRNDPATDKQLRLIRDMFEFSDYPLPLFEGKTKGEAADYINKYAELAHEDVNNTKFGY